MSQWNEATIGSLRGIRGASWQHFTVANMQNTSRADAFPTGSANDIGFRVSQVPEPASLGIVATGLVAMLLRPRKRLR